MFTSNSKKKFKEKVFFVKKKKFKINFFLMSDANYNKFGYPPISQPTQYPYNDSQNPQPVYYPPQPVYYPPQPAYIPPPFEEKAQYQYPSSEQLQVLHPENEHHNPPFESSLKCLIISLFTTMVYQLMVIFSFAYSGFEVGFPWNVLLGFFCSLGDLALLYMTIRSMRKSKKKKKEGKYGAICFGISFVLFKLTYAFTFNTEIYFNNDHIYYYSPSTGSLMMQYALRIVNFIMGIIYLKRRHHFD